MAIALLAWALGEGSLRSQEVAGGAVVPNRPQFAVSLMGGYRFLGEVTYAGEAPFESVDLSSAPTWGVTLGYGTTPRFAFELQYSYARTEATWISRDPFAPRNQSEIGIHDLQLAVLLRESLAGPDFFGYAGLGAGASIFDTIGAGDDTTKFSFSVSLGVVKYFSGSAGLRLEARWIPAYLRAERNEDPDCGESWLCFSSDVLLVQQFEFRGGATFRF